MAFDVMMYANTHLIGPHETDRAGCWEESCVRRSPSVR
jgi:hypothetical protein